MKTTDRNIMQQEIKRYESNARMTRAVQFGDLVFIGGQTSDDEAADIRTQTAQVLSKVDKYLQMVGIDSTRILSAQVWLADIAADYDAMNEVWDEWVPEGHTPARATVQATLASPALRVEIAVVAAK
ncbi:RidA family protein [Paraburkholderia phytofirmans]|nr:RidA family protein [Paraburkholderia phytofirmans]